MNKENYINDVKKSINKYCKKHKYDFEYNDIIEYYKMFLNGSYLPYKNMDVISQFKNQLDYINNLNH
jgi:hypothetical protein